MKTINERKTIRKYSNREVSTAILKKLLSEAMRTPTMGNLQLYSVVITRDAEKKALLAPSHFNQPMVTEAPVVLTFCADFNRTTQWALNRKATPGYDNFLSFLNAATDALLYCQTFCNLAEAEGLGTCFLGTTIYQPQSIIDTLQLPRLVFPIATMPLAIQTKILHNASGYPLRVLSTRKPIPTTPLRLSIVSIMKKRILPKTNTL